MTDQGREEQSTEEQLFLAAGIAKRGAGDVVSRLQNLMNIGAPSIADLAYTVRLREKEDYKIVQKVQKKRESDRDYHVGRIRDIVGLRIVTLYRLDALDIIPRLIGFFRQGSGTPDSLFLAPEVEEIKIFSTNPKGDAQALPQRLLSLFDSLGYGDKAKVEATPSNYTSIHMVTWCRGRYRETYNDVPIEIQVRTALEDAWGEIDHKLKYKPKAQKLSVRDESILQVCLAHLNVMKTFIDGAAQYADQIRVQADQVTARRFVSASHRVVQDTGASVRSMSLPAHIRTQIEHALEHQTEAMHPSRRNREFAENRIGSLRNAIREFEISADLVSTLSEMHENRAALLKFYLPMEIALCNFQLGVELRADEQILAEAVRMYQEVQDAYPDRAIVRYRYGRALAALGDFSAGIKKHQEADDLLRSNTDTTIEAHHWLRLSVPRNIGAYLWEAGELMRASEPASDDLDRKLKALIQRAYMVTKAAYCMNVEADALSDQFDIQTGYRGRLANNLLYYAEDYFRLGGTCEELSEFGYIRGEESQFLDLLETHFDIIETPSTIHTMLRHYLAVDNQAGVERSAKKLERLLRERGVVDAGGKSHDEEMLRMAITALTKLLKVYP